MTFDDIVSMVCARLNLTSTAAIARVGTEVNDRYRRVTSAIGLNTSRRATVTEATVAATATVTFDLSKIEVVYIASGSNRRVLGERTYDEMRNVETWAPSSGIPINYAIQSQDASSITILLDPIPDDVYTLSADGLVPVTDLSLTDEPSFAADYHDILMHGAIADELRKMEKFPLARESEATYEMRLADLRMFINKSAYLAITQGGSEGSARGAYWPGYLVQRRRF